MIKFDPAIHDDNPPMSLEYMRGFKPSTRGRPKLDTPKLAVKLRLDAKTVERLRGSGPGWQTRVNAALCRLVAIGEL